MATRKRTALVGTFKRTPDGRIVIAPTEGGKRPTVWRKVRK